MTCLRPLQLVVTLTTGLACDICESMVIIQMVIHRHAILLTEHQLISKRQLLERRGLHVKYVVAASPPNTCASTVVMRNIHQ